MKCYWKRFTIDMVRQFWFWPVALGIVIVTYLYVTLPTPSTTFYPQVSPSTNSQAEETNKPTF